jgi:hypothetical protein
MVKKMVLIGPIQSDELLQLIHCIILPEPLQHIQCIVHFYSPNGKKNGTNQSAELDIKSFNKTGWNWLEWFTVVPYHPLCVQWHSGEPSEQL